MIRPFAALAMAPLLLASVAAAAEPTPGRYQVEFQLTEAGRTVVSATTFASEQQAAMLELNAEQDMLLFEANLYTVQGDGDEARMAVQINLVRNGEEVAAPSLMFKRGGTARYEAGTEGDDMVRITIKPAP